MKITVHTINGETTRSNVQTAREHYDDVIYTDQNGDKKTIENARLTGIDYDED